MLLWLCRLLLLAIALCSTSGSRGAWLIFLLLSGLSMADKVLQGLEETGLEETGLKETGLDDA